MPTLHAAPSVGKDESDSSDPDFITIQEGCCLIGGEEHPISTATYYRGAQAGRFPKPEHPSPGISRIRRQKLLAMIGGAK